MSTKIGLQNAVALLDAIKAFDANGIEIPFRQMVIHRGEEDAET